MIRPPPRSTLFPSTTLFRSSLIKALPGGESVVRLDPEDLELTSDPPLDQQQIVALIGSQQQIAQAIGGDIEGALAAEFAQDRKSTRLNSSHANISYAVFCLK